MVQKLMSTQSNPPYNAQLHKLDNDTGLQTVDEEGNGHDPEKEADFGRAYQKLVSKFYKEQGGNILIPDMDLEMVDAAKVDIGEVQRRIIESQKKKDEKIRIMKAIQEEKEIEGCTFAP